MSSWSGLRIRSAAIQHLDYRAYAEIEWIDKVGMATDNDLTVKNLTYWPNQVLLLVDIDESRDYNINTDSFSLW